MYVGVGSEVMSTCMWEWVVGDEYMYVGVGSKVVSACIWEWVVRW